MHKLGYSLALVGVVGLAGCGSDGDDDPTEQGFIAQFAPGDGVLPFPTNLVFAGTQDLTVNIPITDPAIEDPSDYSDPAVLANPQAALNAQAGFSTVAPARTTFSAGGLDPESIGADTVRVFEVTLDDRGGAQPVGGPVSGVTQELTFGGDFLARVSPVDDQTLSIVWLAPLAPATSYLVTVTNGIASADGRAAIADVQYVLARSQDPLVDDSGASQAPAITDAQAQALEPVRQLTNAQLAAAASQGVDPANVIVSWTFTTQGIGTVLTPVRAAAADASLSADNFAPLGDTSGLGGQGLANIFQGLLNGLPYYLAPADTSASPSNDPAPRRGFWQSAPNPQLGGSTFVTRFNPVPQANATESAPVLVALPNEAATNQSEPADGWPVVLFQHGITADRTTMLGIADRLAAQGFAAVGIDHPLHGVTDTASPLFVENNERTFDLDLQDNATGEPGPDGNIDASGAHYINLTSLLTARDNLRQSSADLFALRQALDTMDPDGDGAADFDTSDVRFLGHSLGGIVGGVFLALETDVGRATLANPGGGVAKLLDGSATFGPQIAAGLQAAGLEEGTPDFESFLAAAQTVVDTGDPINYATGAAANHELYMIEVLGDQVVPNAVQDPFPPTVPSPTAGTDPLAAAMGLEQVSTTTAGPGLDVIVRFTEGHHSSILTPNDAQGNPDASAAAVFTEMQNQTAIFLDTGDLVVEDGNFVQ